MRRLIVPDDNSGVFPSGQDCACADALDTTHSRPNAEVIAAVYCTRRRELLRILVTQVRGLCGLLGRCARSGRLRMANEHDGGRGDAGDLLGVAAEQQPIHAAATVRAQDDQIAAEGLGLLCDEFRYPFALAFQQHGLHCQAILPQLAGGFVQQRLASSQKAWAYLMDIDRWGVQSRCCASSPRQCAGG